MPGKKMANTKVRCERVWVTVMDESGAKRTSMMPAFTRDEGDMRKRLDEAVNDYIDGSNRTNMQMSLGDFALYCVALASMEPLEV